jgi:hypothetical protein
VAKLQTAEETVLSNSASGFLGVHILNQRLSGSWQRLGVPQAIDPNHERPDEAKAAKHVHQKVAWTAL